LQYIINLLRLCVKFDSISDYQLIQKSFFLITYNSQIETVGRQPGARLTVISPAVSNRFNPSLQASAETLKVFRAFPVSFTVLLFVNPANHQINSPKLIDLPGSFVAVLNQSIGIKPFRNGFVYLVSTGSNFFAIIEY
jgi:hypothetical protein